MHLLYDALDLLLLLLFCSEFLKADHLRHIFRLVGFRVLSLSASAVVILLDAGLVTVVGVWMLVIAIQNALVAALLVGVSAVVLV
jgi:hypothetical protein